MKNLRRLREEKKMTMKALGQEIGVAESTISLYEAGKREPDTETLCRIATYFNVSVDYLLGHENSNIIVRTMDPISILFSLYSVTVKQFSAISGIERSIVDRLSVAIHPMNKSYEKDPLYDSISDEQYQRINEFFHVDLMKRNTNGEYELPLTPNRTVVDKLRGQGSASASLVSDEALNIAAAFDQATEKDQAAVRVILSVDSASPTSAPADQAV